MLDFHIHVLPNMDDGSKSEEMSLEMLRRSTAYGVDVMASTSHFYADENTPQRFLQRREEAYERLQEAMAQDGGVFPKIVLGAEVHFFTGISTADELPQLCLQGTNLLLLEMPFYEWTERMVREVGAIRRSGIQPVAAHIERYMDIQSKRMLQMYIEQGILIQCNAEYFLERKTARHAMKFLKQENVHFLGSDAHNVTSRRPNLGEAVELIRKKAGEDAWQRLQQYEMLVRNSV